MGFLADRVLKSDIKSSAKLLRYIKEEDIRAINELNVEYFALF
ncbi:MAG: hypothetical protein ACYCXQ_02270 [Candidatus Humimicrobiaceae bacterium]